MRRITFALASALFLTLSACNTTGGSNSIVDYLPAEVQAKARVACGFVGNLDDIAKVISAFGGPSIPGVVGFVINAICGSGQPKMAAPSTLAMAEAGVGGRYVVTPRGTILVRAAQ